MPWPNICERGHAQLEPRVEIICIVVAVVDPSAQRFGKFLKALHCATIMVVNICEDGDTEETSVVLCVYVRLI